jgi:hypothetical protein
LVRGVSSRSHDINCRRLQLPFSENGVGCGPFDKDTATTTKGHFKTFNHHRNAGEPISAEIISVFCDVLSSFATNLGGGQAPPPRTARGDFASDDRVKVRDHVLQAIKKCGSPQHQNVARDVRTKWRFNPSEARAAIAEATSGGQGGDSPQPRPPGASSAARFTRAGVEGTEASVLEEFERVWAKGLSCHARRVYMFLRITPPIAKCFVHARVLSRFTTDREAFVPRACCLPSSPPIVKCYFHLHVNSRFTSDREGLSSFMCPLLPTPPLVKHHHRTCA